MTQNMDTYYAQKKSDNQISSRVNRSVRKRLEQELMDLMMSDAKGVSAFPDGENIFKWLATIHGPEGTAYEGVVFKLSLEFSQTYPYSPPLVKFISKCFHPNVDSNGNICLDILKEKWSALYDISAILISIQSLLGEPNNDSPLNIQASNMWSDQKAFSKYVQAYHSKEDSKI